MFEECSNLSDEDDRGCYPENKDKNSKNVVKQAKWLCKKEPSWRIYMKKLANAVKKRENAEREKYGDIYFMNQKEKDLSKMLKKEIFSFPNCRMLNAFNERTRRCIDGKRPKTKIWDDIRSTVKHNDCVESDNSYEWPTLAPCLKTDIIRERKMQEKKLKMKKFGATPCQVEEMEGQDSSDEEQLKELACKKELIHARIPDTYLKEFPIDMVDRACGERIGLVDGDCILYELDCGEESRTYANLCLRGLIGMHLEELQRIRVKTWKFCLFQNIVALLVKTQLRYKYVWSANIDYIYKHAWMMFVHTGYLNTKPNQRFDDILVYNYMYNIELQLVDEIRDIPIIRDATFEYFEESLKKQEIIQRFKVTLAKCEFGTDKTRDNLEIPVHRRTRRIEKWFDKLDDQYTNCILRTTRFSLAFWQDGVFWFLYNPYRCDKFGLWDDEGYASLMKFCTKDALKRHIMILLVRAYVYKLDEVDMCLKEYNYFTIEIYQVIYHSCKIHNVKLYLRGPKKPEIQFVEKTKSDPCMFNPYDHLSPKRCQELLKSSIDKKAEELSDKIERPSWIDEMKISWSKVSTGKSECRRPKWHEFEVLEARRLYVLWSDIHITDQIFPVENRNKQARSCYVVCAGMCQINAPEYWSADVLKAIIVYGDGFFGKRRQRSLKNSKSEDSRISSVDDDEEWQDYPSDQFKIDEILFNVNVLAPIRGRLYTRSDQCLWRTLELFFQKQRFGILTCESARLGIFKHCGAYYMHDVYSRGPPIFKSGYGKSYLLRASCLRDLVTSLVLVIGSIECSPFTIRPVEIGRIMDLRTMNDCGIKKRKEEVDCNYGAIQLKPACYGQRDKKISKPGKLPVAKKDKQKTICVMKENN